MTEGRSPLFKALWLLAGGFSAGVLSFRVGAATLRWGAPVLQFRPRLASRSADVADQTSNRKDEYVERPNERQKFCHGETQKPQA